MPCFTRFVMPPEYVQSEQLFKPILGQMKTFGAIYFADISAPRTNVWPYVNSFQAVLVATKLTNFTSNENTAVKWVLTSETAVLLVKKIPQK